MWSNGLQGAKGTRDVIRRIKGVATVIVAVAGLAACGGALDSKVLNRQFWSGSPNDNTIAELGMADMAKGNTIKAEARFQEALNVNPQDLHALLGLGILYQNNGRLTKAREMYEAILALRPKDTEQFVVWKSTATQPISKIASVNLALIESGGVLTGLGRDGEAPQMPAPMAAPEAMAMTGRAMPKAQSPAAMETMMPRFAEANANIVSRFKTMAALRDQGLLTNQEYATRRQANIGALLPLTSPPPATGLDRPVPNAEQISGRLRAIGSICEHPDGMTPYTVGEFIATYEEVNDESSIYT